MAQQQQQQRSLLLAFWMVLVAAGRGCLGQVMGGPDDPMAQMGGLGSGRRQRDKEPLAVKSDLAPIQCDVCEIVVGEVWREVEKQRASAPREMVSARPGAPKKERSTFSEADVNTVVQDVCNRRKEIGEWLWYVDLVTNSENPYRGLTKKEAKTGKDYLFVERRQRGGPIRTWDRESATAKRSCDLLFDEDVPDLDEFIVPLWRGIEEKEAKKLLCRELSGRCSKQRKPVDALERQDFQFVPQDRTMLDTERMMENMADQGMPMVMQSRDDMLEELMESMMSEGMSEEEAKQFIEDTTASIGRGGAPEEELEEGLEIPDFMNADLSQYEL